MLDTLTNKTHQTAVTVAGFSGLSLAELRGLRWENIGKDVLTVQRTYWHREEGETKTAARKAEVPLIPQVSEILKAHRKRNPNTQFVFEGPYFRPLDLATMGSKGSKKALQGSKVDWHGWHALRRGLGTNLHDLGVQDKTIQAILRHSNVRHAKLLHQDAPKGRRGCDEETQRGAPETRQSGVIFGQNWHLLPKLLGSGF
jgi:integrase